jgi:putative hydrolase of the HAD superfamily
MVRAVFFDLDDTLYSSTELSKKARITAIEHMVSKGLEMEVDEAYVALMRVVTRYGSNYGHHFERFFTDELGLPPDYRMISAAIIAYHHTKFVNMRPYPHTIETIIELRTRGYRLAVISDGLPLKQWEKLVRLGMDDFFDQVLISGDETIGVEKPNPKLFEIAMERTGSTPDSAVMVGDKLRSDVDGANNAGITSIWFKTPRDSEGLPEELGIRPDYIVHDIREVLEILEG